jgi:hypothetical protein
MVTEDKLREARDAALECASWTEQGLMDLAFAWARCRRATGDKTALERFESQATDAFSHTAEARQRMATAFSPTVQEILVLANASAGVTTIVEHVGRVSGTYHEAVLSAAPNFMEALICADRVDLPAWA